MAHDSDALLAIDFAPQVVAGRSAPATLDASTAAHVVATLGGAMAGFVALLGVATWLAGGFEYPLDDVYIHLALAEQIAAGGYGVNAGEAASAASSPLYPLLLAPFAGTSVQWLLPFAWNLSALLIASVLLGALLAEADLGRPGLVLAALAPIGLNLTTLAYTGMEHVLHVVATLLIVEGLWRTAESGRVPWTLALGVVLAPAFRLEGLALALAAGAAVTVLGRVRSGLALMALAALPAVAFVGTLVSLGLDPLPNSITAKLAGASDGGLVARLVARVALNLGQRGGLLLLLVTLWVLGASLVIRVKHPRRAIFGVAVGVAGLGHLALGGVGWMDRYEIHALVASTVALALVLSGRGRLQAVAVAACLAAGTLCYATRAAWVYSWNAAAIHLQQTQMARLAYGLDRNVAVNDLGRVAWSNPNYVLDLWGLASAEALETRLSEPDSGWAGELAASRGVSLAMVYDKWLLDAVGENWVRLGTLETDVPRAYVGDLEVAFYATAPAEAEALRVELREWARALPPGARFIFADDAPSLRHAARSRVHSDAERSTPSSMDIPAK